MVENLKTAKVFNPTFFKINDTCPLGIDLHPPGNHTGSKVRDVIVKLIYAFHHVNTRNSALISPDERISDIILGKKNYAAISKFFTVLGYRCKPMYGCGALRFIDPTINPDSSKLIDAFKSCPEGLSEPFEIL